MIDIKTRIHDRFAIEFKVGFVARNRAGNNDFAINTWFFLPRSLDINALTYDKKQFYIDIKSNVRLITPVFRLSELAGTGNAPLRHLENALKRMVAHPGPAHLREYEYQLKMFLAIFKSALREEVLYLQKSSTTGNIEALGKAFLEDLIRISSSYRELSPVLEHAKVPENIRHTFAFGDEFMSNAIDIQLFRLLRYLEKKAGGNAGPLGAKIKELIKKEAACRREKGFPVAGPGDAKSNGEMIYRQGVLKKYIESDLYLKSEQKSDSFLAQQVYFSIAAGISMVFATGVAFLIQQKYGNLTIPLFVALVVSYMLKDRIKDLMRYYFAHKLGSKYFDNKIRMSLKGKEIGWSKEAVDFISEQKVPERVRQLRSRSPLLEAENRINDEKILLYRKKVQIDRRRLEEGSVYELSGINDIMRVYIDSFIRKTDDPDVPVYLLDDGDKIAAVTAKKLYYINIIMQFKYEDSIDYKRFRIACNRSGIVQIEEVAEEA